MVDDPFDLANFTAFEDSCFSGLDPAMQSDLLAEASAELVSQAGSRAGDSSLIWGSVGPSPELGFGLR